MSTPSQGASRTSLPCPGRAASAAIIGDQSTVPNRASASKWHVFAAVSLGVLVTTIDASSVSIALPAIGHDFNVSLSAVSWVNLAYLLAVAGMMLSLGRLADALGRRRIYVAGFALFTLMALLCGLATSLSVLIAFRILQAIGAAMMFANSLAILTVNFPPMSGAEPLAWLLPPPQSVWALARRWAGRW